MPFGRFSIQIVTLIQIGLCLFAVFALVYGISRPLVDYDEATYAHITVDTLRSGDIFALQIHGVPWLEKPPFLEWFTMMFVSAFGTREFVFRLPVVICTLLIFFLVYRITKILTKSDYVAALATGVLLTSNLFLIFAREMRTDQGVVLGIVGALFFWIQARQEERYAFWIFPMIGIGFMFKSVIALLALPILCLYAFFYNEWQWIRSRYTWIGFITTVCILAPWHIIEMIRFGNTFLNSYIGFSIVQNAVVAKAGTHVYDYGLLLLQHYQPWVLIAFLESIWLVFLYSKKRAMDDMAAPLLSALGSALLIIVLFSNAGTHLPSYILPAFPFLALYIALATHSIFRSITARRTQMVLATLTACYVGFIVFRTFPAVFDQVPPVTYDERSIGIIYKNHHDKPLYLIDWPIPETINYYGDTAAILINSQSPPQAILHAPFLMVVTAPVATQLFHDPVHAAGMTLLYKGEHLGLIDVQSDVRLR